MVSAKAESDVPSEAQSAALNVRALRLILVDFIITDLYFYSDFSISLRNYKIKLRKTNE